MRYNRISLAITLLLVLSELLISQSASETRIYEKSFHVTDEMRLEVTNKYGKVHVTPTLKDSVIVRIEVEASAGNPAKLKKLIEGVSFDLTSTNYFVIAKTNFNRGPINLIESIRSLTNNLISSETRLEINYYITAPAFIEISIDNRYGDIFIESMDNEFDVRLSNGSLKVEDLYGESSFNLDFFDATFNSIRKARIHSSYGDVRIKTAGELDFTSIASKIDISTARYLKCDSKRDKFYLKEISILEGNSYFSDYEIDLVDSNINLFTRYGSVTISRLWESVSLINIESTYTNVYLNINPDISFNMDIRVGNCPISIPDTWLLEEKVLNKEQDEYLYTGTIGISDTESKVFLDMTRGRLTMDEKE